MPNWKKLIVSGSDANLNSLTVETSLNAVSITGSLDYTTLNNIPTGLISGSSQVDLTQTQGYSSLNTLVETQKNRIDSILLASDADKDSFAEIVTLINSVDTTNDTTFASYVLSNDTRSTNIENNLTSISSSFANTVSNISTDYNDILNIPAGIISSSVQIASDISGSFVAASSSIHLDISNLQAETINLDTRVDVFENSTYKQIITGSSIYYINHNLGEDFPIVQVYDIDKRQAIPAEITSSNSNQVQIEFSSTFNGTVVIKK